MNIELTNSVSFTVVFIQGLLSFFSPCVLPLLPLYMGYLSGGTVRTNEDGKVGYDRKRVMLNTLFFVIGIGFSFVILGFGMRAIGRFFGTNQLLFARIGGVIVILFGLYQLGVFRENMLLDKERRIPIDPGKMAMSPIAALIMGFFFSFAWTPCVGPTLSGVLLMAGSVQDSSAGFGLIGIYTLGFSVPFLLAGLFTTTILNFFKEHRSVVRYTVKISGILLIVMGFLMVAGQMNSISGYLSGIAASDDKEVVAEKEVIEENHSDEVMAEDSPNSEDATDDTTNEGSKQEDIFLAPDFTLTDQYGNVHTLSDYKGKVVFLNFWATWCPPCRAEMPDIQKIYEENDPEVVILGVAFPGLGNEKDADGIGEFLAENGYTYPTVMDEDASLIPQYYISAYPTTFMIDKDGNIFGYVAGSLTKDIMEDIIKQTKSGNVD